jgi:UDP-N-acetylglucosamine--N-acetylmuramyl-(pentapeptide) pyrophosphoryl-undecaprenol N-acetylglucosamine transferase
VRGPIALLDAPAARLAGRTGRLRLLIVGGSQGAAVLNEVVPEALARIHPAERPEVRHQCGERALEASRASYLQAGVDAKVEAFIEDMAAAYTWADLVVCRAGALTVSELAVAGVAAILVPLPTAIDDHQSANARWLSGAGAAHAVAQPEFTPAWLAGELARLGHDRAALLEMANRARALGRADAADAVAAICLEVAR